MNGSHSHGVKEEIREEAVPLNQDPCGEGEPNGGNHGGGGEEFLHRKMMVKTREERSSVLSEVKLSPCRRFPAVSHW